MFTTKDDIARFTARVALDEGSPRVVEIAGDRVTPPRSPAATTAALTGRSFHAAVGRSVSGPLAVSKLVRRVTDSGDAYPVWQAAPRRPPQRSGAAASGNNDLSYEWSWTSAAGSGEPIF